MVLLWFRFLVRLNVAGDEFGALALLASLLLLTLGLGGGGLLKNGVAPVVPVSSNHGPSSPSASNEIGVGGVTANIGLGFCVDDGGANGEPPGRRF